jgi:hypothetical protein
MNRPFLLLSFRSARRRLALAGAYSAPQDILYKAVKEEQRGVNVQLPLVSSCRF